MKRRVKGLKGSTQKNSFQTMKIIYKSRNPATWAPTLFPLFAAKWGTNFVSSRSSWLLSGAVYHYTPRLPELSDFRAVWKVMRFRSTFRTSLTQGKTISWSHIPTKCLEWTLQKNKEELFYLPSWTVWGNEVPGLQLVWFRIPSLAWFIINSEI